MGRLGDNFFRNYNIVGNPIVEAIEALQRDVENINGNVDGLQRQVTDLDLALGTFRNTTNNRLNTAEIKISTLLSGDYTFVKWYGAVGDGVTDDTASIQAAINSGKTYIIFDKGDYLVSSAGYGDACLLVPSNKCLLGLGATLINRTPSSITIVNKSPALEDETAGGGYSANKNITICNLNFVGDNNISLGCVGFAHCDNVKIIDCNFKDIGGWHFIELNSTRNAIISGCSFDNYVGPNLTEMIQLDMATNADVFPFFGPYDDTMSQDIIIENCRFTEPYEYYSNSNNYFNVVPAAIGNHNASAQQGQNIHHVSIQNCYFENVNTCIKFSALRNSIIANNSAYAVRHFFIPTDPDNEHVYVNFFAGLKINNNKLITDPLPAEVITVSQSSRTRCIGFYGKNCQITNNSIYGWSGYGISVGGSGHLIANNDITACGRKAIYVFGSSNCNISNNIATGNCLYNMAGDYDFDIVPDANNSPATPANNDIISGNLFDTARLENPDAVNTAFTNNVIKTSLSVAAGDDCVVHNNLVNGSWSN